jgi:peptidoglycan hydrolase CwlO-like protein
MAKTLEEISNDIAEAQKKLKEYQDAQYLIEDEILKLQKQIIDLQGKKKDKEIIAGKGKHNIRQLVLDIKMLTNLYFNLKT